MADKYENLLLLRAAACCTCVAQKNAGLDFGFTSSSPTAMTRANISIWYSSYSPN